LRVQTTKITKFCKIKLRPLCILWFYMFRFPSQSSYFPPNLRHHWCPTYRLALFISNWIFQAPVENSPSKSAVYGKRKRFQCVTINWIKLCAQGVLTKQKYCIINRKSTTKDAQMQKRSSVRVFVYASQAIFVLFSTLAFVWS